METWQETLRLIVRQNKTFSLRDKEKNEFKLMTYFVNDIIIRNQIILWIHNLEQHQTLNKKNIRKSEELRKKGNKEFQNKRYIWSIKFYTLSLQFAPWESEDLSLALANRSAALFYLGNYEACIKDIELAVEYNYPLNMIYKLYLRAAQCYLKLGKKDLVKQAVCKVQECLENNSIFLSSKKDGIEKQINLLLSESLNIEDCHNDNDHHFELPEPVFGYNKDFSNASVGLDLNFSVAKGRYVVANRDIKKGEILFVEKPFAFVLLDNNDSEAVCANCCKSKGDTPVPCKFCASSIYCSRRCLNEAWSTYHQWECYGNQISMWDQIGIAHLTVRTFLNCCYTNDKKKFNEIQRLVTNIDKIAAQDMFVYGVVSIEKVLLTLKGNQNSVITCY